MKSSAYITTRILLLASCLELVACGTSRSLADRTLLPPAAPSASQREHVLRTVAGFKHLGFQVVAARLKLGVDTSLAWRQLDTLVSRPTGDMFWMYPATGFYLNTKGQLDSAWRGRFRQAWKSYTPYRGDTENHFVMYYTSLLLMSQEWPDLPGTEWFNGKSSQENRRESAEFLEHWIDETVRQGSTEWDSPRYAYYYITPLLLLRDFVSDERLRKRSEMMLELTLADYAAEYLNGSYCGAHSRDGDGSVVDPRKAEVSSYGQLYFTDSISFVLPDLAYAAMSPWQCPPIIRAIAHDRDSAFVHTETKRSRAKMRFSDERFSTVRKYNYMTPDYCLGSIQGGLHQPIQQHSWDVTFAASRPNNTLFSLHPTWSAEELGMFFPEDPELMVEGVARAKASYTNENKWIGGSPHEFIAQEENVLVALYDIPSSATVRHVDLFLPKSLDEVVRHPSGWTFATMESAMVAVRVYADSVAWIDEPAATRLRAWPGRALESIGVGRDSLVLVVTVCQSARETTFDEFVQRMVNPSSIQAIAPREVLPGERRQRDLYHPVGVWAVNIDNGLGRMRAFDAGDPAEPLRSRGWRWDAPFVGEHVGTIVTRDRAGAQRPIGVELRAHGHVRTLDFDAAEVRETAPVRVD